MPLTETEIKKIVKWLEEREIRGACPACGRQQWGIGEIVSAPVSNPEGGSSSESIPALVTVCGHCGYIMLFSAIMMGLR